MKKTIYTLLIAAITAPLLTACSFLDEEPTVLTASTSYSSLTDAQYALNGVYGAINSYEFYGQYYSIELSLNDDTCFYRSSNNQNIVMMTMYDSGTKQLYDLWTKLYAGIRNANAFLEAIGNSGDLDKDGQMRNQARFLRAFYYYNLAQCWGDVPLRLVSTKNYEDAQCAATPQLKVLEWVISEMNACIEDSDGSLDGAPSKVTKTAMQGFLARVHLFKAGATVEGTDAQKKEDLKAAMDLCASVMGSGLHSLNPDYTQVFINMIGDKYDHTYYESMWEADFVGNRESADYYSNGRIGDLNGISSTGSQNYSSFKCNYSYGMFGNTPKIWDLYMVDDRTDDETDLPAVTDLRQEWNIPPYHYQGYTSATLPTYPYGGDPNDIRDLVASIDKAPYVFSGMTTNSSPLVKIAGRCTGKFRREVCYEGQQNAKNLYTGINFPILRYSDVLLMFAEAQNEYEGAPSQDAYEAVKAVRDRAGIATRPFAEYASQADFRQLVRNERARELCFEALRKYDLIRWGIFKQEMNKLSEQAEDPRWSSDGVSRFCSNLGARYQDKHIILPLPDLELGVNSLLKQNPLW